MVNFIARKILNCNSFPSRSAVVWTRNLWKVHGPNLASGSVTNSLNPSTCTNPARERSTHWHLQTALCIVWVPVKTGSVPAHLINWTFDQIHSRDFLQNYCVECTCLSARGVSNDRLFSSTPCGGFEPGGFHTEILIICKLSSRKFSTQDDIH